MMARLSAIFRFVVEALLGVAIAAVARALSWTLKARIRRKEEDPGGPVIYAFCHGHQLPLLRYPRPRPTAALVSLSRDGSLQARVLGLLGFRILRGSSSSGGAAALKTCLEWLGGGGDLALAVDGPRGPAGKTKPGVLFIADRAQAPIVPVACSASRGTRLRRAWDGFLVPAPFARVPILSGEIFRPWEKEWTDERKLAYLDSEIAALVDQADHEARA
jgi:lysophospholipid acyltransferase (LPLAT)-like uncharacterized protein